MIESPLLLTALIVGMVAVAFVLERRVPLLSKVGASIVALLAGAVISNLGLVPLHSPVYTIIQGPVTSLAVAWLLLAVNLSDLKVAGPRMTGAFLLAGAGTVLGTVVGSLLFAGEFGENSWKLGGVFAGTYFGGGVNFVAVARTVGLPDSIFVGVFAADAITTTLWMGVLITSPMWLGRFFKAPVETGDPSAEDAGDPHPFFEQVPLSTMDLANLLAMGFVLLMVSHWVADFTPFLPPILWLTTLALIVGHVKPFRKPPGALQLGTLVLHFFFVVTGIQSRFSEVMAVGVDVLLFTVVVVGIHGVVVFGVGRMVKLDIGSLATASQAAIGGPSGALAVAAVNKWNGLVLPGIIVGLLGYALGNYLGLGVAYLLRGIGVGL